ncbi:octaprenyl diphosphate synthase [Methylobacillus flagellatus]|uniref:Octaprenyl diphosphate synthase n=1 Tax=Methylobacillus flagellatus (strain ATCC 51484 / DSM 6875 / VKM B-1610 / KT) TaxID=265072 RepID=Q1GZ50_METFK|nr:octaprenyl diphosphate synthase [Methylobacillus flagellatus]ABE50487.1 Trans-hexaprenyltranstransferase [Methylobacillus flagellatus KT]
MSLAFIQSCIAEDMQKVDAVIRKALHSDVVLINQVADYIINSGGKRLRPTLVLLSAGAFGRIEAKHHELAAIIELIHTSTLLHDDVVDESSLRRGKATANTLFGNAASVLVGDFIYSRTFQMMVGIQSMRVMEVLSDATNTIAEGEVLQLLNVHDADITDEAYLRVIHYKTAKLFEAATRLGAIICGTDAQDEAAMAEYGMRLGTAFQLVDDVLDLSGDSSEIGKNLGDDLAEGKPTLPLLYAMRHGTEAQHEIIRNSIEKGGLQELPAVVEAVKATGALEHVRELAKAEAAAGCAAIMHLPESTYKEALLRLADFAVSRRY